MSLTKRDVDIVLAESCAAYLGAALLWVCWRGVSAWLVSSSLRLRYDLVAAFSMSLGAIGIVALARIAYQFAPPLHATRPGSVYFGRSDAAVSLGAGALLVVSMLAFVFLDDGGAYTRASLSAFRLFAEIVCAATAVSACVLWLGGKRKASLFMACCSMLAGASFVLERCTASL